MSGRVVCSTVENLHNGLTDILPRVKDLISDGVIQSCRFFP